MRFSTLVTVFALLAQANIAFAQGAPPVAGDGQLIQRRAPGAPPPEQPGPEQGQPPPQQEEYKESAPLPGEGGQVIQRRNPNGPDAGGYDDGEGYGPEQNQQEVFVENEQYMEGTQGEFYRPGFGGVPVNFAALRCKGVFVPKRDPFTGAPMKVIVGVDRFGREYLLTPAFPIGPNQINVALAINGLIKNGVCPGPIIYLPPVVQPNWNYGYQQLPQFLPYQGQPRVQPFQPLINPRGYAYPNVYGPRMGYGRPPGPGPYAAPPGYRR